MVVGGLGFGAEKGVAEVLVQHGLQDEIIEISPLENELTSF
jgi:hypothetical protein